MVKSKTFICSENASIHTILEEALSTVADDTIKEIVTLPPFSSRTTLSSGGNTDEKPVSDAVGSILGPKCENPTVRNHSLNLLNSI